MKEKTKGKLTLAVGAGRTSDISREAADQERESMTIMEALRSIARETDNHELAAMLEQPRLAIESFEDDTETPLSPQASWRQVLNSLKEQNVELGVARSHEGGITHA